MNVTSTDPFSKVHGWTMEAATFQMRLLPPHIHHAPAADYAGWFIADRIRAFRRPHCNPLFRAMTDVVAETYPNRIVSVMDVGSHLGDCCLWATARWGTERMHCLSLERDKDIASAIRRSVELNGFEEVAEVRSRTLGAHRGGPLQCSDEHESIPLDCFMVRVPSIDMVKIHTGGGFELTILGGFVNALKQGKVGILLLRTTAVPREKIEAFIAEHNLPYNIRQHRESRDTVLHLNMS